MQEDTDQSNEDKTYTKEVTMSREINIRVSWSISEVEGPIGEVPRDNPYDFTDFDRDVIEEAVDEWYDNLDMMDYVDFDDESGEETESDSLQVEFDDELAPITVTVECEVTFDWSGDDETASTEWEES